MGLFSKLVKTGTTIATNFNKIDDINNKIDTAINIADSIPEKIDKIKGIGNRAIDAYNEYSIKKSKKLINDFKSRLLRFEDTLNTQYNQAIGKNNETNIQIIDEHKIDFSYAVACKYNDMHYAGFNMYVVKLYDKYGVITPDDEIIIPFEYDFIIGYAEEKFCAYKDKKWGFIDINNNVVIDFVYEDADSFSGGLAPVSKIIDKKELYGYIDPAANIVIPYKYDIAESFKKNGLACVGVIDYKRNDLRTGVINTEGHVIVNCNYSIIEIEDEYIAYATENFHSLKFFNLKGIQIEIEEPKEEIPKNKIIPYFNSRMQYGYYIHTDKGDFCKIEPSFEETHSLNKDGYSIVKKDGLYGIIQIKRRDI